jgi:hypothetical protein
MTGRDLQAEPSAGASVLATDDVTQNWAEGPGFCLHEMYTYKPHFGLHAYDERFRPS